MTCLQHQVSLYETSTSTRTCNSLKRLKASSLWPGWRWRALVAGVLMGVLAWLALTQNLSSTLQIDAHWTRSFDNQLELVSSTHMALKDHLGQTVIAFTAPHPSLALVVPDAQALQKSSRWLVNDAEREQHLAMHAQMAQLAGHSQLGVLLSSGDLVQVSTRALGWAGLPMVYWLVSPLVLSLYVVALAVLLAKFNGLNVLYALMALSQAGNLTFIVLGSVLRLSLPSGLADSDESVRLMFDFITAAAIVHAVCIYPNRLPHGSWVAGLTWASVTLLWAALHLEWLKHVWWWAQISWALVITLSLWVLRLSYRAEPHPFVIVLRRFITIALGTWILLSLAIAASTTVPELQYGMSGKGITTWYVFLASLLLLVPFLSRSQHVIREFALLTTVSTIAMSVNLLFVSLFSLGQFASLALSLFVSIGVYVGSRQWLVNQLLGSSLPSAERMFERLYRVAREVEEHPERTPRLLSRLLQEMFEPLELKIVQKTIEGTRVINDGSTLLLPIPVLSASQDPEPVQLSMMLRFAHRGRRLFTLDDARLTDRIIEQLARAVAYDKAVERGRSEERSRLAQDLHDDIGARLLTLMYTAPTPEIEEYARHTLQDLKTLTRGLAAANHRLSHAAAEWKSDLSQRLSAAHIELDWRCEFDTDTQLSVVQWSALTRIMRELINNVIAHAGARNAQVHFRLFQQQMMLQVSDNGSGRNPQKWSHGLGLGGIRKRAKQLGASVEWLEANPRGTICRVLAKEWGPRQASPFKFETDKSQRLAEQVD